MSDRLSHTHPAERRRGHRRAMPAAGDPATERVLRSRLRMLSVVPGLLVWGLLVGAWVVHLLVSFPAWWAVAVATVGCGAALMAGGRRATAISEAVHTEITVLREHADGEVQRQRAEDRRTVLDWLQHFHSVVAEGRKALLCALEQIERGEHPSAPGFAPAGEHSDDPFAEFGRVLQQAQREAFEAVRSWA